MGKGFLFNDSFANLYALYLLTGWISLPYTSMCTYGSSQGLYVRVHLCIYTCVHVVQGIRVHYILTVGADCVLH